MSKHAFRALALLVTALVASTMISPLARAAAQGGTPHACGQDPSEILPGLTNQEFYFLSEILPAGTPLDSRECGEALACFLGGMLAHQEDPSNNLPSPYSHATLIVDRKCVVTRPLVLPNRFTVAGVGIEGEGVLSFDLPQDTAAISFPKERGTAPARYVTIRDLNIVNRGCCQQTGIDVSNSSFVYLERVRLHRFEFGLSGSTAFSILVDDSNISTNRVNVMIGNGSTTWRIRDTVMNQAQIGVWILPTSRGHLISGGRVESNQGVGAKIEGFHNVIENSWFEGNGGDDNVGVLVETNADHNRILNNVFSTEGIVDLSDTTQTCFNMKEFEPEVLNNCGL